MTRAQFMAFCKSLPAAAHVVQWGDHDVWKVGGPTGKVFAIARFERGQHPTVTFKVSEIGWEVLREAEGCRPAPYLASRGLKWIQSHEAGLSDRELKQYLEASHAMAAQGLSKAKRVKFGL